MSWKDERRFASVGLIGAWVSGELLGNVCRSRRMLGWGGYGSVKVF